MSETVAAQTFAALTTIVILFQGCLAIGVPWGKASMGGKFPGRYPTKMRVVAVVNMIILGIITAVVLSNAGLFFPQLRPISHIAMWFIVVFFTIGTILNFITPSKIERIWAPIALIQLVTAIIVAMT